jgi:nucleotide-binding universal stress UspA family protein
MRWKPEQLTDQTVDSAPVKILCAYDGSEVARAAKDLALEYFLPKRKNIHTTFCYVDDPNKTYLPAKMRKGACEQEIEMQKFLFKGRVDVKVAYRDQSKCVGQHIVEEANDIDADFIIIGMWGRKGVKDHSEDIIASNANYALQYASCSTILIQEPFLPYSQVQYLVPMDLSRASEKALVDALLLSEPDDTITALHIVMRDETDRPGDGPGGADPLKRFKEKLQPLIDQWTTELDRPRNVNIVYQHETWEPASKDILTYVEEHNIHIVCVGANAARVRENKSYMGSTSAVVFQNCVRMGVPVVVAHYDEQFEAGLPRTKTPLPRRATIQDLFPDVATSVPHSSLRTHLS